MTDGMKSTEFWLVVGAGLVLVAFIIAGYVGQDVAWSDALEALQGVVWAVVSYVLGRSAVKAAGNFNSTDAVKEKILEALDKMQEGKS